MDVLRNRLKLEMARRAANRQIEQNKLLLETMGKRRKRNIEPYVISSFSFRHLFISFFFLLSNFRVICGPQYESLRNRLRLEMARRTANRQMEHNKLMELLVKRRKRSAQQR